MRLSQVCKLFRSIMLEDPRFWQVLEIGARAIRGPQAAMEFLERSRDLPLTLIHYRCRSTPRPHLPFKALYDRLSAEPLRIQSIIFGGRFMPRQRKLIGQALPTLSSIKIFRDLNPWTAIVGLNQPSVASLYLRGITPYDMSGMSGLTELVLDVGSSAGQVLNGRGNGTELLDVLRQVASHLVILKILGYSPRGIYPPLTRNAIVDLPRLALFLEAENYSRKDGSILVQYLQFPDGADVFWAHTEASWPSPQQIKRISPCTGDLFWKKGNVLHYPSNIDFDELNTHMVEKLSRRSTPNLEELIFRVSFHERLCVKDWLRKFVREVDETNLEIITIFAIHLQSPPTTWVQQLVDDLQAVAGDIFIEVGRDMCPLPECTFVFCDFERLY